MAYRRKPIYEFEDENSVGLANIPNGSKVIVKNYEGKPKEFTKRDDSGIIGATDTVKAVLESSATPTGVTEATEDRDMILDAQFNGYGYTKRVPKKGRWESTDIPNTLIDKTLDPIRFSDGLIERTDGTIRLPDAPFAPQLETTLTLDQDVFTATANKGEVIQAVEGSELVVNGTFDDDSAWALGADWEITDGVLSCTDSTHDTLQDIGLQLGVSYVLSINVTSFTKGSFYIKEGASGAYVLSNIKSVGTYTTVFTASSTGDILLSMGGESTFSLDNISVKAVPQRLQALEDVTDEFVFSDKFTIYGNDELLDYSVNGVTTQESHKSGDIIHVGNGAELVTGDSATFTDGIGDWELLSGDAMTHDDTAKVGVLAADTSVTLKAIPGKDQIDVGFGYIVSFTLGNMTNQSVQLFADGSVSKTVTTNGVHTVATHTNNNSNIYIIVTAGDAGATVDNISVTPIEQTYQALTDTTAGDKLNTSKFQKIDYITRTDVILLTKTGYKTFKGTHSFAPQTSNKEIAEAYGFSWNKGLSQASNLEVINSNGELEVISGEVIVSGLVSRLGNYAYHPVFGVTGGTLTYAEKLDGSGDKDNRYWYNTSLVNTAESIYDSILYTDTYANPSIVNGLNNGRPDSKFYDKIYFDGLGGIRSKLPYAIKPNLTDLLKEQEQLLIGVDDDAESSGVECLAVGDLVYSGNYNDINCSGLYVAIGVDDYIVVLNKNYMYFPEGTIIEFSNINGKAILIAKANGRLKRLYTSSESGDYGLPWVGNTNLGNTSKITKTNKALTTAGTNLTIDCIGDPSRYKSIDTTTALQSDSTDSGTELRQNALVWDIDNSKMYQYLDTDDRDNVDMTAEDFTDTAKYEYVIGRYPNSWMNRLDRGLSLGFNPLLISDTGGNLIPDGIKDDFKLSTKTVDIYDAVYTDTSGLTFSNTVVAGSNIQNTIAWSNLSPKRVAIIPYTSLNQPLQQSTPKPIIVPPTKVIANSSHSWYQGGGLTNCVTGKVATNDGKGLVSKVVEDCEVGMYTYKVSDIKNGTDYTLIPGDILLIDVPISEVSNSNTPSSIYKEWVYGDTYTVNWLYIQSTQWENSILWKNVSTPQHDTINLSSSNSPASKSLISLGLDGDEYVVQVMGEEMVWDFDADSGGDVLALAIDTDTLLTTGKLFMATGFDNAEFNNRVFKYLNTDNTVNWDAGEWADYHIAVDGTIKHFTGSDYPEFELWDGNGFGESSQFEQLTSGTRLDDNGNTVRTYCGIKRTGIMVGE